MEVEVIVQGTSSRILMTYAEKGLANREISKTVPRECVGGNKSILRNSGL
jgi:hypothetical protein